MTRHRLGSKLVNDDDNNNNNKYLGNTQLGNLLTRSGLTRIEIS
jgi:hypothetical protein